MKQPDTSSTKERYIMRASDRYLTAIAECLSYLGGESERIHEAARWCAESIASGGVVHVFGAGHSRMPAEEAYPRIGAVVGFHPVVELALTYFHEVVGPNGLDQAILLERVEGYGRTIFDGLRVWDNDLLLIYSSSGFEHVIMDLVSAAQERGIRVIGVTSIAYSEAAAERRGGGRRLADVADLVIDNHAPAGDALIDIEGIEQRVGASASVLNLAVMDAITSGTAEELVALGSEPYVFSSPHLAGEVSSQQRWVECLEMYVERVQRRRPEPKRAAEARR